MNDARVKITKVLENLVPQVSQGQCILFLGAGVHAAPPKGSPYTYPAEQRPLLGGDLAEKLAEHSDFCAYYPDESRPDLMRASLCCEIDLGRKKLVDLLDEHLRKGKKPSPALEMLVALPFNIYITTNYDRLLESALIKQGKDPEIFVYDPRELKPTPDMLGDITAERPLLFKMHGDLGERDSIVITDEDYIRFVQRMSDKDPYHPVPGAVRHWMQRWSTLFVGYSLRDFNLRLLFRTLRWQLDRANVPATFSVDEKPDPLILKVWKTGPGPIIFVTQDLWEFVPWLYKEILREEYPT